MSLSVNVQAQPSHVVSGATGFLGRRLVRALLARGDRVVALVRAGDAAAGRERLRAVLGAPADDPDLAVVTCDLSGPVPAAEIALLGPHDHVWHLAAHLDLGERRVAHMVRVNVGGTERMLDLASALGDVRFHHVGTAYSCGVTQAPVREGPLRGPVLARNSYERTKHQAEGLVRRAMARGLRGTIYRPSIVVGDSLDGTTEVFGPFYSFLRVCHLARRYGTLTLPARNDTTLDLVPVDRVTAALVALADLPDAVGKTFHLTHPAPPLLADVARVANAVLGVRVAELRNLDAELLPFASNAILRAAGPILPYLRSSPRFERTEVDRLLGADFLAPRVAQDEWLARLMTHGARHGFGVDSDTLRREARVLERLVRAAETRHDVAV